jgi:hypothetical protein
MDPGQSPHSHESRPSQYPQQSSRSLCYGGLAPPCPVVPLSAVRWGTLQLHWAQEDLGDGMRWRSYRTGVTSSLRPLQFSLPVRRGGRARIAISNSSSWS